MSEAAFVETREYQRFHEFCDACRKYQYIGLCYGPPGVGKTLSASHYANWDRVAAYDKNRVESGISLNEVVGSKVVLYTVPVVNTAGNIADGVGRLRERLCGFQIEDVERQKEIRIAELRKHEIVEQQEELKRGIRQTLDHRSSEATQRAIEELRTEYYGKSRDVKDPTELIIVDEADRAKMAGLEQLRALFDRGGVGLVLIGMPGLEKRMARYAQLYSRVGFAHEFKPLAQAEVRQLLLDRWQPAGVSLPEEALADQEAIAAIIRVTGGNFRLLDRLLTQIARVLAINRLASVTPEVVEAARESLVIGTA
jgi:DNA transposition AAA+ family ATPase